MGCGKVGFLKNVREALRRDIHRGGHSEEQKTELLLEGRRKIQYCLTKVTWMVSRDI